MRRARRIFQNRAIRKVMLGVGIAVVTVGLLSQPAMAHGKGHKHRKHRRGDRHYAEVYRGHRHQVRHHARHHVRHRPHGFVVPYRIRRHHVRMLRPYFNHRVYHRAHRHHHAVYRVPVYTRYGVRYRPYVYCRDHLFVDGHIVYDGPRFHVAIRF